MSDTASSPAEPNEIRPLSPDETALQALSAYFRDDIAACNREVVARMQSSVPLIPQLGAHLVAAGGKRMRPLLTLASARLCGYQTTPSQQRHIRLAACVEFIHTATLLHDDVIDESELRRGLASANAVFGNKASVLVGDFLFARSFQLMTEDGSIRVMAILSEASATIAEGEVLQMAMQNDLSTNIETYFKVVHGKTAALFAAACQVGAVLAERPTQEETALARFGENLGMAFQLVDDALDYAADQAVLGKTVGDDLREGKITLPVLTAYQRGSAEERVFWERVIEAREQTPDDLAKALEYIEKTQAISATLAHAQRFAEQAQQALELFEYSELRTLLHDAASYAVNRAR